MNENTVTWKFCQLGSKLLNKIHQGGHRKLRCFTITQELDPFSWNKYIYDNNEKLYGTERLVIHQSKNKNRFFVNIGDPETNLPVRFAEITWNNGNTFEQYNETLGLWFNLSRMQLNYTKDIGVLKLKSFLKWKLPKDEGWSRYN